MSDRPHIFSLTPDALEEVVTRLGMPRYRAGQLIEWVYRKGVADPDAMTNLAANDRKRISAAIDFVQGRVLAQQEASDGTRKLLIDWSRGPVCQPQAGLLPVLSDARATGAESQTECVMIPALSKASGRQRRTACVSSQIGCPVGCRFCASGLGGLDGNLTAGQIVEQVWQLSHLPGGPGPITNVVFMGMGEPLANFEAVTTAAKIMMAPWGPGISGRRITISTVGIPSGIRRLAEMDLPVTLAISLHAPNDQVRRQIIPWAKFVTIDQLIEAGSYYFQRTGREVTLEYILLGGVNDRAEHARELAQVARRLRANINLIRYNEVKGLPFDRPSTPDVRRFQGILVGAGLNTHIRASRGRDIAAACGQLRHEQTTAAKP